MARSAISRSKRPQVRPSHKSCIVAQDISDEIDASETSSLIVGVAQAIAAAGTDVTLLWVPRCADKLEETELVRLRKRFLTKSRISLVTLPPSKDLLPGLNSRAKQSLAVYHYFRENRFDSVFFVLEEGLGYYSLLARETGVFENPPGLHMIAQSTTGWKSEADKFFLENVEQVACAYMEKYCAEECDSLTSTSKALIVWMKEQHWAVPLRTEVLLPAIPDEWRLPGRIKSDLARKSREFVFFAGTEYHKGLTLLCDALDKAAPELPPDLTITMMGRFGRTLGEHTGGMLVRRGRQWPFDLKLLPHTSPREYLSYLRCRDALALFPAYDSCADPLMAACLAQNLPFIATNVGANPEFLTARSRMDWLCDPTATSLAQKMIDVVSRSRPAGTPSEKMKASGGTWAELPSIMAGRRADRQKVPTRGAERFPLVTVVLVHHDRPRYLLQAVKSVEEQDYEKVELILVDDGSKLPESQSLLESLGGHFEKRGWRILRKKNRYLGAARNAGVRAARGSRILFLDDDNALFPSCVSTLVEAMHLSQADICTSFRRTFYGDNVPSREDAGHIQYITLGGSLDIGFLENSFGDATALIRRDVFRKIGYQTELYGRTGEDWEFFARAVLAGLKLRVVPKPTYWYRSSTSGMLRTSHWYDNRLPTLATFRKHGYRGLNHLFHLALSAHIARSDMQTLGDNLQFSPSDQHFLDLSAMDPESDEAVGMLASIAAAEGRHSTTLTLLSRLRQSGHFTSQVIMYENLRTEREVARGALTAQGAPNRGAQTRKPRTGAPPTLLRARECTPEEFSGAKLVTPYQSSLPLMLFPSEGGLFLRPSRRGPVVAVLDEGFPAFARRAIGYVEIAHEDASPFEFAMAMTMPDEMADWRWATPRNCVEFSGWKRVEQKFRLHEIVLEIRRVTRVTLALNLAIRLPKRSEPAPANAFWRRIVLAWDD